MTTRPSSRLLPALCGIWLAAAGIGMSLLAKHAQTPGAAGPAPSVWPSEAGARPAGKASLVLFLHPECPCSRATLTELSRVVASTDRPMEIVAWFLQPSGWTESQIRTGTWRAAERIPGVRVAADPDGRMAALFGALTSGETLLYDENGRLLFQGGITGARGHEGENASESALMAQLQRKTTMSMRTHVYGCSIF